MSPNALLPAMAAKRVDAITIIDDPVLIANATAIANLAARNRLPLIAFNEVMDAGGLMSYGPSVLDMWRRATGYVGKILNGAKPADLPVEQSTKFEFVVNLKTAKTLGLTIPSADAGRPPHNAKDQEAHRKL
jgi:putative tryptophan/tyrosine transport system substrate-binding protein